ncbi:FapA family protein [Achromobacter seleniivolatilans]|uniref:FapA family protein n=1 Tax=Achromobacter seleniivolatilans TaxID=3047478 RepID=A0ABY9LWX0_9BURK|nr:FapA family protein [Achromobacter sp. R39]WMD18724.1 FapA family protein [Achromobacter sp. R39]
MGAENTLQLVLDANTNVLTAIYTPPPRPDTDDPAPVAGTADAQAASDDASATDAAAPSQSAAPVTEHDSEQDGDTAVAVDSAEAAAAAPYINPDLPSWDALTASAVAQGWSAEALDSHAILGFIDRCRTAREPVMAAVGQVVDGSFELDLDPSRMAALLVLHPPKGGKPVTLDELRQALTDRGIVHGVLEKELADTVEQGRREAVLIAQGTPPTRGTPTRFESLLDRLKPRAQEIDELAQVDYRDLGSLLLVTPGTPLMRRIPPLPGVDGANVLGEAILPDELPDVPFAMDLSGVAVDPEDPLLLRAAISGTPTLINQGVQVNPVVEVDAVNLSTGNITFEGSLQVRGDIAATMEVRVTGDVVVNGTIEAALVEAGGSVTVKGGIIGMADALQDSAATARTAHIVCGGALKAKFIENAIISAGLDIDVEREIRQSSIAAGGSINVGPPNTQQSAITGGQTRALNAVRAGTIGSPSGIPTLVQAGLDPHADIKRSALTRKRLKMNEEKSKLEQLLMFLQANPQRAPGDVVERARNTHTKLVAELLALETEEAQLIRDLQPLHTATIAATRRFCSGVKIQLGNKMQEFLEDQVGGKAGLEEGEIVIR